MRRIGIVKTVTLTALLGGAMASAVPVEARWRPSKAYFLGCGCGLRLNAVGRCVGDFEAGLRYVTVSCKRRPGSWRY